ncbi:MAG: hypothetical protein ACXQTZ_00765, partial [Candidatus Alkanophagales archaeon]
MRTRMGLHGSPSAEIAFKERMSSKGLVGAAARACGWRSLSAGVRSRLAFAVVNPLVSTWLRQRR